MRVFTACRRYPFYTPGWKETTWGKVSCLRKQHDELCNGNIKNCVGRDDFLRFSISEHLKGLKNQIALK